MGFFNPVIPWRELEQKLTWGSGWRAEEQLPTSSDESAPSVPDPAREGDAPPWAELHCHSAFSFLDGVSEPEALVAEAARLGVETIGLTDHDGFYGVVRLAQDRKSTRLNSSHVAISYAVFCLKKTKPTS